MLASDFPWASNLRRPTRGGFLLPSEAQRREGRSAAHGRRLRRGGGLCARGPAGSVGGGAKPKGKPQIVGSPVLTHTQNAFTSDCSDPGVQSKTLAGFMIFGGLGL